MEIRKQSDRIYGVRKIKHALEKDGIAFSERTLT
jgi:hypothetical protein